MACRGSKLRSQSQHAAARRCDREISFGRIASAFAPLAMNRLVIVSTTKADDLELVSGWQPANVRVNIFNQDESCLIARQAIA
jgi:hypothetical protein